MLSPCSPGSWGAFGATAPHQQGWGDPAPPAALGTATQAPGEHGRTFGAEQRGIAGLVAEGLPIVLGREGSIRMPSGDHSSLGIASIPVGVQRPPWPCTALPRKHPRHRQGRLSQEGTKRALSPGAPHHRFSRANGNRVRENRKKICGWGRGTAGLPRTPPRVENPPGPRPWG